MPTTRKKKKAVATVETVSVGAMPTRSSKRRAPEPATATAVATATATASTSAPAAVKADQVRAKDPHEAKKIRNERYEARCVAAMRRLLDFFFTEKTADGLSYHFLLQYNDFDEEQSAALEASSAASLEQQKHENATVAKIIHGYLNISQKGKRKGSLRSPAQDFWIDQHLALNASAFCTEAGCEAYRTFLNSLQRTGKAGHGQKLTMEGQKAYSKAINKHFRKIRYYPSDAHRDRLKELHKKARMEDESKQAAASKQRAARKLVKQSKKAKEFKDLLKQLTTSEEFLDVIKEAARSTISETVGKAISSASISDLEEELKRRKAATTGRGIK